MARSNTAKAQQEEQVSQGSANEEEMDSIISYSVDLNDQEKPPVLPMGSYLSEVTGVELKHGKDSGRPYLNIKWSITPDNQPADFVEALGTQQAVTLFQMVFGAEDNPVSRWNMKQFCKAIGQPMSANLNFREFLGRTAKVTVKHGKDLNNNDRPEVSGVQPA